MKPIIGIAIGDPAGTGLAIEKPVSEIAGEVVLAQLSYVDKPSHPITKSGRLW